MKRVFFDQHLDDVEAEEDRGIVQEPEPREGAPRDQVLFLTVNGVGRVAKLEAAARLYLNERKGVARFVAADDIDFAAVGRTEIAVEDLVAAAEEVARGEVFAVAAEPLARVFTRLRRGRGATRAPGEKSGDGSGKAHGRGAAHGGGRWSNLCAARRRSRGNGRPFHA